MIVLGVAVFTDLRSRRIPNWLVLPFLPLGIAVSAWFHGWHGVVQSLEGAGVGILVFGVFFVMGGMGAGDVKLCAAIGAWIGPGQLFIALVLTGLAGGVMVIARMTASTLAISTRAEAVTTDSPRWWASRSEPDRGHGAS